MKRYLRDPLWIIAKFNSKCSCGNTIKRGETIFYYPATKTALCTECGESAALQFMSDACDEAVCNGCGNPF